MGANIGQIPAKIRLQNGTGKDKMGTVDIYLSLYTAELMVNNDSERDAQQGNCY